MQVSEWAFVELLKEVEGKLHGVRMLQCTDLFYSCTILKLNPCLLTETLLSGADGIDVDGHNYYNQIHDFRVPIWKHIHQRNTTLPTVIAWENASTGNNTSYDNIQPRQRSSPNTGLLHKSSPDLNEGPTPTYLIGRSSFLTEIPAAEGGQRMLLAYKLCTRASSEECSNIGALEKSTRCNGHFLLFPSFLYVFLSLSLSTAYSFSLV